MFGTSVALNAVDCLQTDTAIKEGREEGAMPIRIVAGGTPTTNQIAAYAITANTLKYFIADVLPGNYRKAFLGVLILGSTFTVIHNHQIVGVRISFPTGGSSESTENANTGTARTYRK